MVLVTFLKNRELVPHFPFICLMSLQIYKQHKVRTISICIFNIPFQYTFYILKT